MTCLHCNQPRHGFAPCAVYELARRALRMVAQLTRERDALAAQLEAAQTERDVAETHERELRALQLEHESEVAELTEALATTQAHDQLSRAQRDMLQAEVERLKEALAAAERRERAANLDADANGERAELAETQVDLLLARIAKARNALGGAGSSYGAMSRIANAIEALRG